MNRLPEKLTGFFSALKAPSTDVAEVIITAMGRPSLRKMGFILLSAEYEIYGHLYFLLTGFERYHGVDASLDFARRFSRMQDFEGSRDQSVTFLGSHVKKV